MLFVLCLQMMNSTPCRSIEEFSEIAGNESSQMMQSPAVVLRRSPRKKLHLNESDSEEVGSDLCIFQAGCS